MVVLKLRDFLRALEDIVGRDAPLEQEIRHSLGNNCGFFSSAE